MSPAAAAPDLDASSAASSAEAESDGAVVAAACLRFLPADLGGWPRNGTAFVRCLRLLAPTMWVT